MPGHQAPDDTTRITSAIMAVILDTCAAGRVPGEPASPLEERLPEYRARAGEHPAPPTALRRALAFWTRLHGVPSLELAGRFTGMRRDPARLYTAEVESVVHR